MPPRSSKRFGQEPKPTPQQMNKVQILISNFQPGLPVPSTDPARPLVPVWLPTRRCFPSGAGGIKFLSRLSGTMSRHRDFQNTSVAPLEDRSTEAKPEPTTTQLNFSSY